MGKNLILAAAKVASMWIIPMAIIAVAIFSTNGILATGVLVAGMMAVIAITALNISDGFNPGTMFSAVVAVAATGLAFLFGVFDGDGAELAVLAALTWFFGIVIPISLVQPLRTEEGHAKFLVLCAIAFCFSIGAATASDLLEMWVGAGQWVDISTTIVLVVFILSLLGMLLGIAHLGMCALPEARDDSARVGILGLIIFCLAIAVLFAVSAMAYLLGATMPEGFSSCCVWIAMAGLAAAFVSAITAALK